MPDKNRTQFENYLTPFIKATQKPFFLILFSLILGGYLAGASYFHKTHTPTWISIGLGKGASILLIFSLFWLLVRLVNTLTHELRCWGEQQGYQSMAMICRSINHSLKVITFLSLILLLLPFLAFPGGYLSLTYKVLAVCLIASVAWLGLKLINIFEQFTLQRCRMKIQDSLHYRKVHTQIVVLKRVAAALVIFLALVSMLMVSDKVRELGTTLLASAGIIAAIGTFAAQRTLSGIVGGIQIALTQPIHLNDMVLIENELGQIEEISLSYVVLKLQDSRRMIVPVSYFIEKPFQNLSRNTEVLQGNVSLFVDYSVSIETLRETFLSILKQTDQWDQRIGTMQVVETKPGQMELRFFMSASDSVNLWGLRCEIREKLIAYVKQHYPDSMK